MRTPAALTALLLAAAPACAEFTYPVRRHNDITTTLAVEVLDRGETPGAARVRYTLNVTGGPGLSVETPRLADADGGWKWQRASSWALERGRSVWAETFLLEQSRLGSVPLPDVKVRFREGPAAPWVSEEWADILPKEPWGPPSPAVPPPPPDAGSDRRTWAAAVVLTVLVSAVTAAALRHRRRPERTPTPEALALREIDRLEALADSDTGPSYAELSDVVRRYLAARYGLPALQQTTAEFLAAASGSPGVAAELQPALYELLGRCDLGKFAGPRHGPGHFREAAALARAVLSGAAPPGPSDGPAAAVTPAREG